MDRNRKKGILLMALILLLIVLMVSSLSGHGDRGEDTSEELSGNVINDLPDGEVDEVKGSKSEAYQAASARGSIENYWDECEELSSEGGERNEDPVEALGGTSVTQSGAGGGTAPSTVTSQELFGSTSGGATREQRRDDNPYRETPEQREARHQKRREETIDLAEQISGRNGDRTEASDEPAYERIELGGSGGTGIISSLDGDWDEGGVSTLGTSEMKVQEADRPVRCMFVKDERLRSGQRVTVRILEDLNAGGTVIPKNTHLSATCSISTRLTLDISSIEVNGDIIQLGYEAYDSDGSRGIYCPETGNAAQTARSSGLGMLGSTIGGRVGRIAGQVVQTGISIAQSQSGERTVSIPSGYTFFLVRKKNI